jgi:hypothetical protein
LIADCLRRCRESGSPLATLAVFLKELRQRHYGEDDIGLVDRRARRVLWALLDQQEALARDGTRGPRSADDRQPSNLSRA